MKCVRCEAETDNDFGEDTRIYVESLQDGSRQKARHLCVDCLAWLDDRIEKFFAKKTIELTPKGKELRGYFDT